MDLFYGRNGHKQDIPQAIAILEKGIAKFDHCTAWFLLGYIDIVGAAPYRPRDISAGVEKIVRAAKGGEAEAFMRLMGIYRNGHTYEGVYFEKNEALAGAYAVEIADAIDPSYDDRGMINATAAWAYFYGHGVPKNRAKAAEYFRKIQPWNIGQVDEEIRNELQKAGY